MSIKRSLSQFRAEMAGIKAVALTDLSTGTVLAAESAIPMGQEDFDHLANEANVLLSNAQSLAYVADAEAARLFLRSASEPTDALILVLADTARDVSALSERGAALLAGLADGAGS